MNENLIEFIEALYLVLLHDLVVGTCDHWDQSNPDCEGECASYNHCKELHDLRIKKDAIIDKLKGVSICKR